MAHYIRIVRTPCNLLVYNCWENRGDSIRNQFTAPGPYTFYLSHGAMRVVMPLHVELPPRWIERARRENWNPRDMTLPAPMLLEISGPYLGGITEAAEDDTRGVCLFPMELGFLSAVVGKDMAEKLLDQDTWTGHFDEFFDSVRPTQRDPRELARMDGEVSILDAQVLRDAIYNDIMELRVPIRPGPRSLEEREDG